MKCYIYIIEAVSGNPNKIGHKYVGQTTIAKERIRQHFVDLRGGYHHCNKLQNYFNKYGESSLEYRFIMPCKKKELNFYEKFFIKCFDSRKRGFNETDGGDKPPLICKGGTLQNSLTGEIVNFNNSAEFARQHNFNKGQVTSVVAGTCNFVREWFNPQKKWRPSYHIVIDPKGKEYHIPKNAIKEFCKIHNLNCHYFGCLLYKDNEVYHGWTRSDSKVNRHGAIQRHVPFKLKSPTGEIFEGKNLKDFAKKHNIEYRNIYAVVRNSRNYCQGWTVPDRPIMSHPHPHHKKNELCLLPT
jgi:hypothetical protein